MVAVIKLHLFMHPYRVYHLSGITQAGGLYSDTGNRRELDLAADRVGAIPFSVRRAQFYHYTLSGASLERAKLFFVLAGRGELEHDMRQQES